MITSPDYLPLQKSQSLLPLTHSNLVCINFNEKCPTEKTLTSGDEWANGPLIWQEWRSTRILNSARNPSMTNSGSSSQITTTLAQLYFYHKNTKRKHFDAHNSIFGSHDATLKTYIKITTSYYWPGIYQDIKRHVQTCLTCQQWKKATVKQTPLAPLPVPGRPRWRIHADLSDPCWQLITTKNLCYASQMHLPNLLPS